jgi:hypothetical protein
LTSDRGLLCLQLRKLRAPEGVLEKPKKPVGAYSPVLAR